MCIKNYETDNTPSPLTKLSEHNCVNIALSNKSIVHYFFVLFHTTKAEIWLSQEFLLKQNSMLPSDLYVHIVISKKSVPNI